MIAEENYIPVDGAIKDFERYLRSNGRAILSAKYGDGKSFFLNKIYENIDLSDEFEFITLYPINYQVESNKDIIEYIKRDILFQLILKEMVTPSQTISETEMWQWFVIFNGGDLLSDFLPYLSQIGLPTEISGIVTKGLLGLEMFKKLTSFYKRFKEKCKNSEQIIDGFLENTSNDKLGNGDIVTNIIRKSIDNYRESSKKKIVLVIEDLDRIDPGQIFRILNILSAHIDNGYRGLVPTSDMTLNKFGVDNIILVADIDNIEHIFHHMYGDKTDFNGYISKFTTGPV